MRFWGFLVFFLLASCKVQTSASGIEELIISPGSRDGIEVGFSNPDDPDEIWIPSADEYIYLEGTTVADTFDHNGKPIYNKCAVGGMALQLSEYVYVTLDMQKFKLQNECAYHLKARVYGLYWNPPWPTTGQQVFAVKAIEYLELTSLGGNLVNIMAIGGETSGYGLKLANGGVVELELPNGFSFEADDEYVDLSGYYKTIFSVTRGEYQVFVVEITE